MTSINSRVAFITSLVLVLVAGGCQSQKKASTPKEALTNYANSILSGDQGLFLASTTGLPADQAKAVFEIESETAAFDKAFESAYGKDAARKLSSIPCYVRYQDLLKAKIRQDGNKAFADPAGGQTSQQELRKVGEYWCVDISSEWNIKGDANLVLTFCRSVAEATRQAKALIGKEGLTSEKVRDELQGRLLASILVTAVESGFFKNKTDASSPVVARTPAGDQADNAPQAPGAPPKSPMDGMTPQQKLAYAQAHFAADLRLVKKHPWGRAPGADVQEAARRVFGIGGAGSGLADAAPAPAATAGAEVNFLGLSKTQVQSLVGHPSAKSSANGEDIWTYAYKGTQLSASLAFRKDKVVRASGGAG